MMDDYQSEGPSSGVCCESPEVVGGEAVAQPLVRVRCDHHRQALLMVK